MRTTITFATFILLVSLQGVVSVPLKALVAEGSLEVGNKDKVKEATEIANGQIRNMQAVLDGPNPQSHPAVVKAFGNNANIDAIRQNVNTLANGKIRVPISDSIKAYTQGGTNADTKEIGFGSTFYSSDAHTRAGTVIHESAHALLGSVDHFDPQGNPHPQGTTFDKGKAQFGYKDSHMEQLKAQVSHNMHHNADSYRVFGEECPQARELFERALIETDPLIQSDLVRRGGASCAWRPKGKAAPHSNKAPAHSNKAPAHSNKAPAHSNKAPAHSNKAPAHPNHTNGAPSKPWVGVWKVARPVAKVAGSRRPIRSNNNKRTGKKY